MTDITWRYKRATRDTHPTYRIDHCMVVKSFDRFEVYLSKEKDIGPYFFAGSSDDRDKALAFAESFVKPFLEHAERVDVGKWHWATGDETIELTITSDGVEALVDRSWRVIASLDDWLNEDGTLAKDKWETF